MQIILEAITEFRHESVEALDEILKQNEQVREQLNKLENKFLEMMRCETSKPRLRKLKLHEVK